MAEAFIDYETGITKQIKDEHELVKIKEKDVIVGNIGKIVTGEVNSQEIQFSIPRYYDNVDLLGKNFYIIYKTSDGIYKVDAVNISYNSEEIRFNWLMSEDATRYPGSITAVIKIEGTNDDIPYVLKTVNFSVNVEQSLCEYGVDGVYHTWATDIEERITKLETVSSSPFFIGTMNNYEQAVSNGEIVSGMFVTITDK